MKLEMAEKWVNALRGGEFKQGRKVLHNRFSNTYCCLGVLDKLNSNKETYNSTLGRTYRELGLYNSSGAIAGTTLTILNDSGLSQPSNYNITQEFTNQPFTFQEIADVIQMEYILGVANDSN